MFELREDIKLIQTARESIVAIIESINQPMVAARGQAAEPAKAYIVGVRNASGLFSVYVYLYLVNLRECLIYLHDPPEIQMEAYHDTELEALGFVESMGFMVDNLNFRNMQPEQQVELMTSMPCFQQDLAAWAKVHWAADAEVTLDDAAAAAEGGSDAVDLSPLEDDVIELEEVAEVVPEPPPPAQVITPEGLAKIIRMLSSF